MTINSLKYFCFLLRIKFRPCDLYFLLSVLFYPYLCNSITTV